MTSQATPVTPVSSHRAGGAPPRERWRGAAGAPGGVPGEATRRPKPDLGGLVWIGCRYPVIAAGLERVLRKEFRVHRGQEPPEEDVPSFVVLFADDAEALSEGMEQHARKPHPDALVVVFGPRADLSLARAALRAGARGYIHAENTPGQIIRALKVVENGEIAAPRKLLEYLVTEATGEGGVDLDALSYRQREVLQLVAEGLSNAQIGERLFLSESTVKQHLRSAYKLLGVKNRTEAARLVRSHRSYSRSYGAIAG